MSVEKILSTRQVREDGRTPQKLPPDDAGPSWQSRCIYAGDLDVAHPYVSPLNGEIGGRGTDRGIDRNIAHTASINTRPGGHFRLSGITLRARLLRLLEEVLGRGESGAAMVGPHFCCKPFSSSLISGGNLGKRNAICSRMPHEEPTEGCVALP